MNSSALDSKCSAPPCRECVQSSCGLNSSLKLKWPAASLLLFFIAFYPSAGSALHPSLLVLSPHLPCSCPGCSLGCSAVGFAIKQLPAPQLSALASLLSLLLLLFCLCFFLHVNPWSALLKGGKKKKTLIEKPLNVTPSRAAQLGDVPKEPNSYLAFIAKELLCTVTLDLTCK